MDRKDVHQLDLDQLARLFSVATDGGSGSDAEGEEPRPAADSQGPEELPGLVSTQAMSAPVEHVGSWIGPYRLVSVLGEGGMGIVYMADQTAPVQRRVALKVIKPGMDSQRVIARFEAERQALALLDHPNIAHVYDAGTTEAGRPYFVMEYVKGPPITDYCDRHRLRVEDRLRLFQQVCHAVQHAHQKGIIHRDLKPSNILISAEDDRPTAKIIDFGVAKALNQPLTDRTLFTEDSHLLGTPEYMSPEQAEMVNEDIDTRSDIYSLGVLLYVLLTGILPYDSETFRQGGVEHIRKIIRETDPKTPSTRLTKLGEEARKLAESRRTECAALAKRLRNELEWIPLKAMRKERAERYRSASEFADDIENYLKGNPLIAGPVSTVYRLKKSIRRNRTLVTGVAVIVAVLIAGVVGSTFFAIRAERARAQAQAVADFLQKDLFGSIPSARSKGRPCTLLYVLEAASESLEGRFTDEPLVEASIRRTLGWAYRELDQLPAAETHLERALQLRREHLGPEDPQTLDCLGVLAWLRCDQGQYKEAAELAEESLHAVRRLRGDKHAATVWAIRNLGCRYFDLGRYDDAEQLFLEAGQTARQVLGQENLMAFHLGHTYCAQGRYDEAERQYKEQLRIAEPNRGDQGYVTKSLLAQVYIKQRRHEEARDLYLQILPLQQHLDGPEHWRTLRSVNGLAQVYALLGDYDKAESHFQETLKSQVRKLRSGHPNTLTTLNNFGVLRREQGRYEDAEKLLIDALNGRQANFDKHHPECLESKHELGLVYIAMKRYAKAELLLLDAYHGRETKLGPEHPDTIESLRQLVTLYESWPKPDAAATWRVRLSPYEVRSEEQ